MLAAALIVGGVGLCATGVAFAAPPPLQSGDPRAVVHSGNTTTCAGAGLAGDVISVTFTSDGTYITVTAVPAGVTVTGVVVKGAPGYNVYLPGTLGALPWTALHPPLAGNSGQPATISHWFACATKTTTTPPPPPTTTTTTTTKTTTTTTTTAPPTTTTRPTKTTTTTTCPPTTTTSVAKTSATTSTTATTTTAPTTTTTTVPTTTTTSAAAPVIVPPTGTTTGSAPLAFTGFAGGWLIVLALALTVAGVALLTVPTLLARRR
jgi:hypothetical protein